MLFDFIYQVINKDDQWEKARETNFIHINTEESEFRKPRKISISWTFSIFVDFFQGFVCLFFIEPDFSDF